MASSSRDNYHSHHYSDRDNRKRRHSQHHRRDADDDDKNYHHRRSNDGKDRRSRYRSPSNEKSSSDDEKFDKLREILNRNLTFNRELLPDSELPEMMARNTLPCFDRERDFEPIEMRRKFFQDAKVGDEIACKVLRIAPNELELKPECTLTRYRRCLYRIPFPPTTVIAVCESELLACSRNDLISATISQIDYDNLKLFLTINNYGIPLKNTDLPAYYRKLPEISLDEPDLNLILGLAPFVTSYSALPELREKDLDNPRRGPQALRKKLKESTAAKLVEKAAALVREKNNEEGFRIFTEALEVLSNYVPALIGRSAAYANLNRYDEALADLRIVQDVDPDNQTALQYLSTVLLVYGKAKEAEGRLESALEKYQEALELTDDNRARILCSELKAKIEERNRKERKKKEEVQKQKLQEKTQKERHENSKKLREMEKFIESLKKK